MRFLFASLLLFFAHAVWAESVVTFVRVLKTGLSSEVSVFCQGSAASFRLRERRAPCRHVDAMVVQLRPLSQTEILTAPGRSSAGITNASVAALPREPSPQVSRLARPLPLWPFSWAHAAVLFGG